MSDRSSEEGSDESLDATFSSLFLINDYIYKIPDNKITNVYAVPNMDNNYIYFAMNTSVLYVDKNSPNHKINELIISWLKDMFYDTVSKLNLQIEYYLLDKDNRDNTFSFLKNSQEKNSILYDFNDIKICDLKINIAYRENDISVNINANIYAKKLEILYEEIKKNPQKMASNKLLERKTEQCKLTDEEKDRKEEEEKIALCEKTKNYVRDGVILKPWYKNIMIKRMGCENNEYTNNFIEWANCKIFQLKKKLKYYTLSLEEEEKIVNSKMEISEMFGKQLDGIKKGVELPCHNHLYMYNSLNLTTLGRLFAATDAMKSLKYKEQRLIRFPFAPNANFNKNDKFNEWLDDMVVIIMNVDKCSETYKLADKQVKEMFPNIANKDFIIPQGETANYSPIKDEIMRLRGHYIGVSLAAQKAKKSLGYIDSGIIKSPFDQNAEFNKTDKFNEWLNDMWVILRGADECTETYQNAHNQVTAMFPTIDDPDYIESSKTNYEPVKDILRNIRYHYQAIYQRQGKRPKECVIMGGSRNKTKKNKKHKKGKRKNKSKKGM